MRLGIGNAKTDDDLIEKLRLRQRHALPGKIVAGAKDELVNAGRAGGALQQGAVAAAIRIGHGAGYALSRGAEAEKLNGDTRPRLSLGGIEDMGR